MIKRLDLKIEEGASISANSFPLFHIAGGHNIQAPSYDVFLGRHIIAQIIESKNGAFQITHVYGIYKNLNGAIRALLRRLNAK